MIDTHYQDGVKKEYSAVHEDDEDEDEEEEVEGWSWWWEQMMIWHHGPIWPEKDEFASFSFTLPLAQHSIAQLGFLWKHGKAFLTHHFFGQTGQSLAEKNALWIIDKINLWRGGGGSPFCNVNFIKCLWLPKQKWDKEFHLRKLGQSGRSFDGIKTTQFKGQRH